MTVSNAKLVKVSKALSFILRHNPGVIGLKLDKNGYANVDELVERMSSSVHNKRPVEIDKNILREIVETDDKQRYAYDMSGLKIRASQGHSLKNITIEMNPREDVPVLYHGTTKRNVLSIIENGIKRMNRQFVHLTSDLDTAIMVGNRYSDSREDIVVFELDVDRMLDDGILIFKSANGVWLTEFVDSKYIKEKEFKVKEEKKMATLEEIDNVFETLRKLFPLIDTKEVLKSMLNKKDFDNLFFKVFEKELGECKSFSEVREYYLKSHFHKCPDIFKKDWDSIANSFYGAELAKDIFKSIVYLNLEGADKEIALFKAYQTFLASGHSGNTAYMCFELMEKYTTCAKKFRDYEKYCTALYSKYNLWRD